MGQEISLNKALDPKLKAFTKYLSFTAKYVESIKEKFELICNDDLGLDLEKFMQLLRIKNDQKSDAEAVFSLFDLDGSRNIDSYEFLCALALMSQATLQEKAQIIFNLYDFDRSQIISQDELVVLARTVICSLHAMSGDKFTQSISWVENLVKQIFLAHDKDHDGGISFTEFMDVIRMDKDLLSCLLQFGFISTDDFGINLGSGDNEVPVWDPFIAREVEREKLSRPPEVEAIKLGNENAVFADEEGLIRQTPLEEKKEFEWLSKAGELEPTSYRLNPSSPETPNTKLLIEHVYGYRCWDVRGNGKYYRGRLSPSAPCNEIVYFTSGIGIYCNLKKKDDQKQFCEHSDDITCIATHSTKVATGQVGENPKICVWEYDEKVMELKRFGTLSGTLKKGISCLAISSDASKLAAVGMDEDHCLALYKLKDLEKSKGDALLSTNRLTKNYVFDMTFFSSNSYIAIVALREFLVVPLMVGGTGKVISADLKSMNPSALLCVAALGNTTSLFVGGFNGEIMMFNSSSYIGQKEKAHVGPITAILTRDTKDKNELITGGHDACIRIWEINGKTITCEREYRLNDQKLLSDPKICSLSLDAPSQKLLIGTRGAELFEFDTKLATPAPEMIVKAHSSGELWGLAVNYKDPTKVEFLTAGDDGWVFMWDATRFKITKKENLNRNPARCAEFSPTGNSVFIGTKNGAVHHLGCTEDKAFTNPKVIKDRDQQITVIRHSQIAKLQGGLLAVGAEDKMVIIYKVDNNFKIHKKIHGHLHPIRFMDFNSTGRTLRVQDSNGCLFYWDTTNAKKLTSTVLQKDEKWETESCTIGWAKQGIWSPSSLGQDINAVDVLEKKKLLVTGDDFSRVRLFRYPTNLRNAMSDSYSAHAAQVTGVKFLANGEKLVSIGGEDNSIIQWSLVGNPDPNEEEFLLEEAVKNNYNGELEEIRISNEEFASSSKKEERFFSESNRKDLMENRPYLGSITAPEKFKNPPRCNEAPDGNLHLKHVFGFRSIGFHSLVKYSANNKVVYAAAGLGIVLDISASGASGSGVVPPMHQSFFMGHNNDVVSLDIHPEGMVVATGDMAQGGAAKMADIFVWDIETKVTLSHIRGFFKTEVSLLRFSPDGSKLLGFGKDEDHSLGLYDWAQGQLIATAKVDKADVLDCVWKSETEFMTCGSQHVKFWTISPSAVTGKKVSFGTKGKFDPALCCWCVRRSATQQVYYTGGYSGNIYSWDNLRPKTEAKLKSPVRVLHSFDNFLYSGDSKGQVTRWVISQSMSLMPDNEERNKVPQIEDYLPDIVSIFIKNNSVLIGTKGSDIYESKGGTLKQLMNGHCQGEIWGLAVCPVSNHFITGGGDRFLRVWDADSRKMLVKHQEKDDPEIMSALDWSNNGKLIVAGSVGSNIYLYEVKLSLGDKEDKKHLTLLGKHLSQSKETSKWIQDIKISPNNTQVAFGFFTHNANIQIFSIYPNTKKALQHTGTIVSQPQLKSPIIHLDWSSKESIDRKGANLVVNTEDYELKFYDVANAKEVSPGNVRDVEWETWTCKLGFPVQGIFTEDNLDKEGINTVCRSYSKKFLATGNDFSQINLFRYPSVMLKSQHKSFKGHSSRVTRLRFLPGDEYMVSVGGSDRTVILWETDFGEKKESLVDDEEENVDDEVNEMDLDYVTKKEVKPKTGAPELLEEKKEDELKGGFTKEEDGAGDEFLAIKPWMGAIKPPQGFIKPALNHDKAPTSTLTLDYVYGYRSKDCKNNLKYNKTGNIVYNAAALGVVLDPMDNTQM